MVVDNVRHVDMLCCLEVSMSIVHGSMAVKCICIAVVGPMVSHDAMEASRDNRDSNF